MTDDPGGAEVRLHDEGRLSLIAELPMAVLLEAADGRISMTNQAFCDLFGLKTAPEEMVGKDCATAFVDLASGFEDPPGFTARFDEVRSAAVPVRDERLELVDGRVVLRDFLQIGMGDSESRNVWLFREITPQVQLEASIRDDRDAAQRQLRQRSELLSLVSHEVRTPLAGALGLVELLLQQDLTPAVAEIIAGIQESTRAVITLLEDLLDLSRLETEALPLHQEWVPLVEFLEDCVETVAHLARAKGLILSVLVQPGAPDEVFADPSRLRQVILNLLGNAIKFTDIGEVQLRAGLTSSGELSLMIADTGLGIPEGELDRLFDEFQQGASARSGGLRGAGLGLAISRKLVSLMGGGISVASDIGEGTEFTVLLPLRSRPSAYASTSPPRLTGQQVFVYSRHPWIRASLNEAIGSLGGRVVSQPSDSVLILAVVTNDDECGAVRALMSKGHLGRPVVLALDSAVAPEAKKTELLPVRRRKLAEALTGQSVQDLLLPARTRIRAVHMEAEVLVADDAPANRALLRSMLELMNLDVTTVSDGSAAVKAQEENPADLVLMDVSMPVMDGLEAARRIRELPAGGEEPIVALSASTMVATPDECFAAGMDDYLSKPVSLQDLQDVVISHLAGRVSRGASADGDAAASLGPRASRASQRDDQAPATAAPLANETPPAQTEKISSEAPEKRALDLEKLQELVEELGPEDVDEILGLFLQQLPGRVEAISDLDLITEEPAVVRQAVHALGSPAAVLGLVELAQACRATERAETVAERVERVPLVLDLADLCGRELGQLLATGGSASLLP